MKKKTSIIDVIIAYVTVIFIFFMWVRGFVNFLNNVYINNKADDLVYREKIYQEICRKYSDILQEDNKKFYQKICRKYSDILQEDKIYSGTSKTNKNGNNILTGNKVKKTIYTGNKIKK